MDIQEYSKKIKIQEEKFKDLYCHVQLNEKYNELALRMEKLDMCMGSGMIHIKEQDRDIFAPLCRGGYYVEYVQIWGNVYIKYVSKNHWWDFYEIKAIDAHRDAEPQDELAFECIMRLMDKREKELEELAKSPQVEEVLPTSLEYVRQSLPTNGKYKFQANIEHGKRAYDSKSFDAIVIRYTDDSYCGLIELTRTRFGEYYIRKAAPLAGESNYKFSLDNLESVIKNAVQWLTN